MVAAGGRDRHADDDRDPRLVVFRDRLVVAAHSIARVFGDEAHLDGTMYTTRLHTHDDRDRRRRGLG